MSAVSSGTEPYVSPVESNSRTSLTDQVYDLLKEEILRVDRRPGDMLAEADLAARFGVSKTPIREALRLLARDGWVIVLPRKGYLIRPLKLEDVREIFSIRAILEPAIAAQAAVAARVDDIAQLQSFVDQQSGSVDDLDAALQAARRFHLAVVEIAGNGRMFRMVTDLLDEVRRLHFLLPNVESHITSQEELRAHRELVDALAAGDTERASEIMHKHINEVARTLVRGFGGL
jgi:DNA-binding GntR family transcriptional regulator